MNSVLLFHIGQLGDTLVALPAFWAVRRHFSEAKLTLLSDCHPRSNYVSGADLLRETGLFDAFASYPVDRTPWGRWLRPMRMLSLLGRLRAQRFTTLVYLPSSGRSPAQVQRDRRFFAAAGIRHFIGMDAFPVFPAKNAPLPSMPHETDLLLARLKASGVAVPRPGEACMDLRLGPGEEAEVARWLIDAPGDGGRPWVGVGPGSKMPSKRWPAERLERVVAALIERFDVWPVVFGGPEDRVLGKDLLVRWQRGYNACGRLGLRAAAAALQRCPLYVGNDTGTMHLAVAAGASCVAIFSARDWPGRWHPYGRGHHVLRAQVECEGCMLVECRERRNECLQRIEADGVINACAKVLAHRLPALAA